MHHSPTSNTGIDVGPARQIIRASVAPVSGNERVALIAALNRVLAADILSPINVPAHDNSAMDGYALRGADLRTDAPTILKVVGTVHAGHGYSGAVGQDECIRIMTGAVMPADCDTVVPLECTAASDGAISIGPGLIRSGDNRRLRGEDLQSGKPALLKGKVLRPAELGLIASLGIAEVSVQRRLRVAFFSSGDELQAIGSAPAPNCIYDSNRYTIGGMLARLGCEMIDMGIVRDDPAALKAALRAACGEADVIITSGGVSAGDADHMRQVMAQLGEIGFWNINISPGRPMAFGRIKSGNDSAVLFGLPGNPVAVMVTFCFLVRDALLHMMGACSEPLPLLRVTAQAPIRKKIGRTEYQRGILSTDAAGSVQVRITGAQGSGILRSMSEANCMVVLQQDRSNVQAGEPVDVLPFDGLF